MIAFVEAVIHDLGNFWSGTFANAGLPYATTNYVILDNGSAPMQSACAGSEATAHGGPFYCSVGGQMPGGATTEPVIYIGAAWLADATSGVPNEDFSVATVMAHEFGHHVQHQLGVAETLPGKFRELGADCFGGIWANAAYRNGQLAPDDIEEAITVSWNAGSDLPDDDSPDPHGTRGERVSAFTQGYVSGDPATCLEA